MNEFQILNLVEKACDALRPHTKTCSCFTLAELFGFAGPQEIAECHVGTLTALAGPHGKAIYKMLLARKEITQRVAVAMGD